MSDTLPNVLLTPNTWIDLYTATGITVGVKISVSHVGDVDIFLKVQATQPTDLSGYTVIRRDSDLPFTNEAGDTGAWAYSPNSDGKLNVSIAT